MKTKKFKIFATDGKRIWKVFYITKDKKGDFYCGPIISGIENIKLSYHVSGRRYIKSGNISEEVQKLQKLDDFKGMEQLGLMRITKEILVRSIKPLGRIYEGKKFDGSAFIDIKKYKSHVIVIPFLLEPDNFGLLVDFTRTFAGNSQIIIFTEIKPWIVLIIYE